jgi:steroid delta-isomerase-like uncharacterized protein
LPIVFLLFFVGKIKMIRLTFMIILVGTSITPCLAGETENIQIVTSMAEAINARDLEALDDLVAQDIVRHSAATADLTVTNLDEFRAFLRSDFATIPDSVQTIDLIFANDEYVAMKATYSGTQKGPMGPFPASGKKLTLPFIGILRIEDGKVAEIWVEWDNVYALSQLGHLQPPAETQATN